MPKLYSVLLLLASVLYGTFFTCDGQRRDLSTEMDCRYDTGKGATYDLTPLASLTQDGSGQDIKDRIQTTQAGYTYTIGICNSVAPPSACMKSGKSVVRPGGHLNGPSPAWQTKGNNPDNCKYLGDPDMPNHHKWALLDENDPGMGVSLTYTGGQHCTHTDSAGNKLQRALTVNFKCSANNFESFEEQVIDESDKCTYEITLESEYACPTECGFGSAGNMCNNHGVCRYDTDAKRARCFCNRGFIGPGCDTEGEEEAPPTYGPVLGLLVFVTIAVVALIAGIIFLWNYLSKRTAVTAADQYGHLSDTFGNSMMENNASAGASRIGIGAAGL